MDGPGRDRASPGSRVPQPPSAGALPFRSAGALSTALAAAAVLAAVAAVFLAPTEASMGDAQRIVYIHVAVAWLGLLGYVVMAAAGAMYLVRRDLAWDHWALAAAELGWLSCGLTLLTGSLWAHAAWNTWWTWDPRLTASLIASLLGLSSRVQLDRTLEVSSGRRARTDCQIRPGMRSSNSR